MSGLFGGIRIIESLDMVDRVEDWSRVRSPSRAARRRRQGHRQNIRITGTPKKEALSIDGGQTFFVHPATATELRRAIAASRDATVENAISGAPLP